jgi:hypothetical protein
MAEEGNKDGKKQTNKVPSSRNVSDNARTFIPIAEGWNTHVEGDMNVAFEI